MSRMKMRIKIKKWHKSIIRDNWGNMIDCYWNEMAKTEILKLREIINQTGNENS